MPSTMREPRFIEPIIVIYRSTLGPSISPADELFHFPVVPDKGGSFAGVRNIGNVKVVCFVQIASPSSAEIKVAIGIKQPLLVLRHRAQMHFRDIFRWSGRI